MLENRRRRTEDGKRTMDATAILRLGWMFRSLCSAIAPLALIVFLNAQAAADNAPPDGHQVFMQSGCFACHGEMGNGGVGPRFREDRFLTFSDYVVGQILIGRSVMPAFADKLDDQQIAAVASYIRGSWGNQFGEVKPEEVAQVRKQLQQEEQALSGSALPRQPLPANQPGAVKKIQ
jgi:mono/diheme cytochrome c family protein